MSFDFQSAKFFFLREIDVSSFSKRAATIFLIAFNGFLFGVIGYNVLLPKPQPVILTVVEDRKSEWEIYHNRKMKYGFKHPHEWKVREISDENVIIAFQNMPLIKIVYIAKEILPEREESYCEVEPGNRERCERISIEGNNYFIEKDIDSESILLKNHSGDAIRVTLESESIDKRILFENILDSFHFMTEDMKME